MAEERRLVTVLFADVTGSTSLGESMDPEDVRALLGRYYAIAKDVMAAHGGTIEKFIGDAVMAVFGLPVAHGDDPERALAAALELRDRVRGDARLGEIAPIRIGANTGEVVASRDTSGGDFLITGDAVNVAARLQQAAEPWEIVCGERTVRAAERSFAFGPFADVGAKGKRAMVRAARLERRVESPRRLRVPLIGRDSELAQIELLARRALRDGHPQLLSVMAPAGTGKTRLLEEFLDRLPEIAPDATAAVAQCLPYGQRLTFWPLRAVLFRLVDASEDDAPDETRAAIARWLEGAEVEDPARVAELLAATVGASETEVLDRAALFAAWRTAVEVAARRAPLVVVFEDLHWSSDTLLDLVEYVMQPRGAVPVMTIALTRPELLDRRPTWGGGRRNYASIALDPLADGDIARIVSHLLEASPPEVVDRVVARAEGNPFYAGELVRSIMERAGGLDDPTAVDRALASLPDTVQATVLARLDVLPPDERRALQLGAVYGRSFRVPGLRALDAALGERSGPAVDSLLERDMVRSAGVDRYVFRHILIREVAYQTLPRAERGRLHAAAASWLEGTSQGRDEAFAELIAFHLREAATLPSADPDAERDIRRRATAWLRRAAEAAITSAAKVEAKRHLEAAIELAEPELLPELYERLGDAWAGGEAVDAYRTALRLAREGGRPADQQLRILGGILGVLMRMQGSVADRPSLAEMTALRADAAEVFARAGDERAIARYLAADSFFPFWQNVVEGQPSSDVLQEAMDKARRALQLAEKLGDESLQSAALDALGSASFFTGDFTDTLDLALRRTRMRDISLDERLDAFSVACWSAVWLGDLDEAVRVSDAGITVVQPGQAASWALHLYAWRTYALFLRGDWVAAIRDGDRMIQLWNEGGRISAGYSMRGFVAAYHAARGRRDAAAAQRLKDVIETIANAFGPDTAVRGARLFVATDIDTDQLLRVPFAGRAIPAPDGLERALSVASDLGQPPSRDWFDRLPAARAELRFRHVVAQLDRARGLSERDPAILERAREAFERMNARPFVARVRCERALLVGDDAELAAGIAELERIGDAEQIERYERRRASR